MQNIFDPSSGDISRKYLYYIFGSMNGVISSETESVKLFGTMFNVFNGTILTIGVLMIVYVTIVGVMATAHEGEFMGKKWNNMWIPIRTVFGVALLVPTSSGYSALQIIMMWVIMQGIGAADHMWDTVLGYINVAGNPFEDVATLPGSVNANDTISNLFLSSMCMATGKLDYENPSKDNPDAKGYYCAEASGHQDTIFCKNNWSAIQPTLQSVRENNGYSFGPEAACGTYTICKYKTDCASGNESSMACEMCKAQITAVTSIMNLALGISRQYAEVDYTYWQFYQDVKRIKESNTKARDNYNAAVQDCNNTIKKIGRNCPPLEPRYAKYPDAPAFIKAFCHENQFDNDVACYDADILPSPFNDAATGASSDAVHDLFAKYALKNILSLDDKTNDKQQTFIDVLKKHYTDAMSAAAKTAIMKEIEQQASKGKLQSGTGNPFDKASEQGWMMAGAYYHKIASAAKGTLTAVNPDFTYSYSRKISSPHNPMSGYRNNYTAAGELTQLGNDNSRDVPPEANQFSSNSTEANKAMTEAMASNVSGGKDNDTVDIGHIDKNPVKKMIITGTIILWIIMIQFIIFINVVFSVAIIGNLSLIVLGNGFINPVGPTLQTLLMIIVPLFTLYMGIMLTLGGMLSVYVPLIPLIIYSMGAIGWMTSTIETMVAGPLVCLGIISPSGQHELLGKAEPAIMLLFNVFLRPTLMIFGMIAAMFLAGVSVNLVNKGFAIIMSEGADGIATSIIGLLMLLVAYVMTVITALNKSFAAIHIIPERVMRWISGQGEQYGEGEAVQTMKGAIDSATGGVKSVAQTGVEASQKAAEFKAQREKEEQGGRDRTQVKGKGTGEAGDNTQRWDQKGGQGDKDKK